MTKKIKEKRKRNKTITEQDNKMIQKIFESNITKEINETEKVYESVVQKAGEKEMMVGEDVGKNNRENYESVDECCKKSCNSLDECNNEVKIKYDVANLNLGSDEKSVDQVQQTQEKHLNVNICTDEKVENIDQPTIETDRLKTNEEGDNEKGYATSVINENEAFKMIKFTNKNKFCNDASNIYEVNNAKKYFYSTEQQSIVEDASDCIQSDTVEYFKQKVCEKRRRNRTVTFSLDKNVIFEQKFETYDKDKIVHDVYNVENVVNNDAVTCNMNSDKECTKKVDVSNRDEKADFNENKVENNDKDKKTHESENLCSIETKSVQTISDEDYNNETNEQQYNYSLDVSNCTIIDDESESNLNEIEKNDEMKPTEKTNDVECDIKENSTENNLKKNEDNIQLTENHVIIGADATTYVKKTIDDNKTNNKSIHINDIITTVENENTDNVTISKNTIMDDKIITNENTDISTRCNTNSNINCNIIDDYREDKNVRNCDANQQLTLITSKTYQINQHVVNKTIQICKNGCNIQTNEEGHHCNVNKADKNKNNYATQKDANKKSRSFIFEYDILDKDTIDKTKKLLTHCENISTEEEERLRKMLENIVIEDENEERHKRKIENEDKYKIKINEDINAKKNIEYKRMNINKISTVKESIKKNNNNLINDDKSYQRNNATSTVKKSIKKNYNRLINDDKSYQRNNATSTVKEGLYTRNSEKPLINDEDESMNEIENLFISTIESIENDKTNIGSVNDKNNIQIVNAGNTNLSVNEATNFFDADKFTKRRLFIKENKKKYEPKNYVLVDDLHEEELKLFSIFCCKKLKKLKNSNFIVESWKWLKNLVKPEKKEITKKNVSTFFYELQEYLMINAINKNLIFRVCSNKTHFLEIPMKINNNFTYNFDEKTIHENAGVYKGYIREVLNGLFPTCISKTLVYIAEKYSLDDLSNKRVKELVKYLPFTMTSDERKILVSVFEMWDLIDLNEIETCMNYETLAIVFSPSIFEQNFIKKIEHAKVPTKLAKLLFFLDYNKIDFEVYQDFCKETYNKK